MKRLTSSKTGMTLIEVVLVVAIIAILGAIIFPRFMTTLPLADIATTKSNLGALRSAVALYRAQNGVYPPNLSPSLLSPPPSNPTGQPYLDYLPLETISDPDNRNQFFGSTPSGAGGWYYDSATGKVGVNLVPSQKDAQGTYYSEY